jgi:hypothetical protein
MRDFPVTVWQAAMRGIGIAGCMGVAIGIPVSLALWLHPLWLLSALFTVPFAMSLAIAAEW